MSCGEMKYRVRNVDEPEIRVLISPNVSMAAASDQLVYLSGVLNSDIRRRMDNWKRARTKGEEYEGELNWNTEIVSLLGDRELFDLTIQALDYLGNSATRIYTFLNDSAQNISELEERTKLTRATVYLAILRLAEVDLARRVSGGWIRGAEIVEQIRSKHDSSN